MYTVLYGDAMHGVPSRDTNMFSYLYVNSSLEELRY